jgi:hypothetical protein
MSAVKDVAAGVASEVMEVSVATKRCCDDRRDDCCNDDMDGDSNDVDNSDDDKDGDNKHNYVPYKKNVGVEVAVDEVLRADVVELGDEAVPGQIQIFPIVHRDK